MGNLKRISKKLTTFLSAGFLSLMTGYASADDTDIYTTGGTGTPKPVKVMFTMDYSTELSATSCTGTTDALSNCDALYLAGYLKNDPKTTTISRYEMIVASLKMVFDYAGSFELGFMMNHAHDANCAGPNDNNCSGGGYVLQGFLPITTKDNETKDPTKYALEIKAKQALFAKLDTVPAPKGFKHDYQGKELFFEIFRYLTGQGVYSGHLGWNDFNTSGGKMSGGGTHCRSTYPALDRDHSVESDTDTDLDTPGTYKAALTEDCTAIYTINFIFNDATNDGDADTDIVKDRANGGMQGITLKPPNDKFTNVIDWLHRVDLGGGDDPTVTTDNFGTVGDLEEKQNVTSFFIAKKVGAPNADKYAAAGGTTTAGEFSDDPGELVKLLRGYLNQILSVSTTFTAASVPVSVLNRAQIINNVYIALFKADKAGNVRWPGNLKKLEIDTDAGYLKDANGNPAIAIDGRIKNEALTYWTDTASLPAPDLSNGEVTGKDGRAVQRGGAGQKIPGFMPLSPYPRGKPGDNNADTGARQLFTEPKSGSTALEAFGVSAVTTTMRDGRALIKHINPKLDPAVATHVTLAETVVRFARGQDVNDEDADASTPTSMAREWILGDPLHSRPVPINYGAINGYTADVPDIRLVMGSNDGWFRMFRNTVSSASTQVQGEEVWAFTPLLAIADQMTLMSNPIADHVYTVDGAPTVYQYDKNNDGMIKKADGDVVYVFFGMRRGDRALYGLDISDPDSPSFLWSISRDPDPVNCPNPSDAATCKFLQSEFSELGYSFSQPKVGMMKWGSYTSARPVLIVGGGYDMANDSTATKTTNDSMGNAVFIIDAQTGELVWKAVQSSGTVSSSGAVQYVNSALNDSIPSAVTAVDTTGDGLIDRAYVGDTGGAIWRADFAGTNNAAWTMTQIADLGRRAKNADEDRRFFHRIDFVKFTDGTAYDAIIVGSGDRADPLGTDVVNYMYMIKDRFITSGTPPNPTNDLILSPNIASAKGSSNVLGDITENCLQRGDCTSSNTPDLTFGWQLKLERPGEKVLATATTINKAIYFTTYVPTPPASGSCVPSEGKGYLYVVALQDGGAKNDYSVLNGDELDAEDRSQELKSGGIPAEVVYIPFNKILKPDLTIEEVPLSGRWRTYWYETEI